MYITPIKRVLSYGLLSLLSTLTLPAQATCCCPRMVCCLPAINSNLHGYVEFGLGQGFNLFNNNPSPSSVILLRSDSVTPKIEDGYEIFTLFPKYSNQSKNLQVETGLLWQNPSSATAYLPFVSAGLQYQYTPYESQLLQLNEVFVESLTKNIPIIESTTSSFTSYNFSQHSLLATLKLDLYRWRFLMPYVKVGMGTSWQHITQKSPFNVAIKGNPALHQLNTADVNKPAFSYSVGGGVDVPVTSSFWLSLGYQYQHVKAIDLKPTVSARNMTAQEDLDNFHANERLSTQAFRLHGLSTQTIQLTGRYLFG